MKTFEEYIKLPYKIETIPNTEESGFVVSHPELSNCITCGEAIWNVNLDGTMFLILHFLVMLLPI